MERLELTIENIHKTGIQGAKVNDESSLVQTLNYLTPKQITQSTNEIIAKKIDLFKILKKGTVALAIPKITKTKEKYECINCGYTGEMSTAGITGYEHFTRINREGKEVKDSRFYTTSPMLDLCPECGAVYREKEIAQIV